MPYKETQSLAEHLTQIWPFITGTFLVLVASIKLWWYDRNETRKLINNNHSVVMAEIKALRSESHKQHTVLVTTVTNQMIALFKGKT
jgi:hypothetical protein